MENFENLFKKFIYTGVGIISLTKEKLEKTIEDLVKSDKISAEEGKKIVDEFLKNAETKKDEFEAQTKEFIDKAVKNFSFATKKDVDALLKRIEELESLLAKKH